jgi:hypothetical protein
VNTLKLPREDTGLYHIFFGWFNAGSDKWIKEVHCVYNVAIFARNRSGRTIKPGGGSGVKRQIDTKQAFFYRVYNNHDHSFLRPERGAAPP